MAHYDADFEGPKNDPDSDEAIRGKIAQLLTHRCSNCYRRLPGPVGCNVHSPGWNWVTPNFGPFCDDCIKEVMPDCCFPDKLVERIKEIADPNSSLSFFFDIDRLTAIRQLLNLPLREGQKASPNYDTDDATKKC